MEEVICSRCGSDDYTTEESGVHLKAVCGRCGSYIKFLSQTTKVILYFGKYKDRDINTMNSKEELEYLNWLTKQSFIKPKLKSQIFSHLDGVPNEL